MVVVDDDVAKRPHTKRNDGTTRARRFSPVGNVVDESEGAEADAARRVNRPSVISTIRARRS